MNKTNSFNYELVLLYKKEYINEGKFGHLTIEEVEVCQKLVLNNR